MAFVLLPLKVFENRTADEVEVPVFDYRQRVKLADRVVSSHLFVKRIRDVIRYDYGLFEGLCSCNLYRLDCLDDVG